MLGENLSRALKKCDDESEQSEFEGPAVSRDGHKGHDADGRFRIRGSGFGKNLGAPLWTLCEMPLEIDIATLPRKLPVMAAPPRQLSDEEAAAVPIPPEWREEFEAAAQRPLQQRMRYAFIRTYKPVLDDALFRSWDSTAQYRQWCESSLPDWLGYGRV